MLPNYQAHSPFVLKHTSMVWHATYLYIYIYIWVVFTLTRIKLFHSHFQLVKTHTALLSVPSSCWKWLVTQGVNYDNCEVKDMMEGCICVPAVAWGALCCIVSTD